MFSKIALYPLIKSIFAQHQSCRSLKFEQLSCWALFHLSFSLKVIVFYSWVPGIFRNCKSVQILPPPACLPALLLWPPPLCSAARRTGPARGHLLLALPSHASRQSCRRSSTPRAGASLLCHAPRTARRPPPRRLRGWLAAAPQDPN